MSERRNTVVCSFGPKSPRISAFDIYEWIFEQLYVPENVVTMVQIDGTRRQVYIKITESQYLQDLLHSTIGQSEYKHNNGENIASEDRNGWNGHEACEVSKPSPETPDEAVSFAFSQ